ncbi:MAG TPA: type II CAAX endopeptidase family protein [Terriglobales bacterium]|nr:type II CAAX endopeptidase family protein [Terriglobales bacterium]
MFAYQGDGPTMDEQNNPPPALTQTPIGEAEPGDLLPQPEPPPWGQSVFLGRDGLRAGWRLLLYFGFYYVLAWVIAQACFPLIPRSASRLWFYMGEEVLQMAAVLLAAVIMARIERRKFASYGLPPGAILRKLFWAGCAWGFMAMTILLVAMHVGHLFDFGHVVLRGARIVKFGCFWAAFFLAVGVFEEFYFRGYPLFTVSKGLGFLDEAYGARNTQAGGAISFWSASVVLSLSFAARHIVNRGENWIGIVAVAVIGMFFCLTVRRTGSLWFAVGFHAAWDWGQSFLYSVPDSGGTMPGHLLSSAFYGPAWLTGGSVGPEGSVLVFVIVAVVAFAFDRAYPVAQPFGGQQPSSTALS